VRLFEMMAVMQRGCAIFLGFSDLAVPTPVTQLLKGPRRTDMAVSLITKLEMQSTSLVRLYK
jgi:hypothetical protein